MLQLHLHVRSRILQNVLLLLLAGLTYPASSIHAQSLEAILKYLHATNQKEAKLAREKSISTSANSFKIAAQIIYNGEKLKHEDNLLVLKSFRNIANLVEEARGEHGSSHGDKITDKELKEILGKNFFFEKLKVLGFQVSISSLRIVFHGGYDRDLVQDEGFLKIKQSGLYWIPKETKDEEKLLFSVNIVGKHSPFLAWLKKRGILITVIAIIFSGITYAVAKNKQKKESKHFFKRWYNKLFKKK